MGNNLQFYEMPNISRDMLKLISVKLAASTWLDWHNLKYDCLL